VNEALWVIHRNGLMYPLHCYPNGYTEPAVLDDTLFIAYEDFTEFSFV